MKRGPFIIKDPEVAKLLADDTRRQILRKLSHEEMSTTDLAKALDRNHSSIVHHLHTLLEAGLIEVTREEKVRNMVQPYYRSVSHNFHVAYSLTEALSQDPDYTAWREAFIDNLMLALRAYNIDVPDGRRGEVRELLRTCYLGEKKAYEERVTQWVGGVEVGPYAKRNMAHILSHMQLLGDEEYMDAIRRLSEIIEKPR
ncbi:helix-turn-helix transcriptional regulator [Candidatus Bathyarchaeota archaeon]|nr:helix-turn-helix transcriptional regulator [Candidatus Bathyarchaeota archaeon]